MSGRLGCRAKYSAIPGAGRVWVGQGARATLGGKIRIHVAYQIFAALATTRSHDVCHGRGVRQHGAGVCVGETS